MVIIIGKPQILFTFLDRVQLDLHLIKEILQALVLLCIFLHFIY